MDFKEVEMEDLVQDRAYMSLPLVNMVYGSAGSVKYRRFLD
jgi:hypothetical protein